MAQMAQILGRDEDAEHFASLAKEIASAFHNKYFNRESATYGNGGQTQMALALACRIVPEDLQNRVFENLLAEIERQDYRFDCGVVGLRKLIDVLMAYDRKDVLYRMTNQTGFPSFAHWIDLGANTMWQNWDSSQSRNHIMFGSIGDYLYYGLAGINPSVADPGFHKIVLTPHFPDDMSYLKCGHKTPYGWIRTDWKRNDAGIRYELSVPQGSVVEFSLPYHKTAISCDGINIENAAGVEIDASEKELTKLVVSPGKYIFAFNLN
jgi:alpha-L-rhamnosidase